MERKQRGLCAACGMKCDDLHVDHEHGTGIVRGLLCQGCNTAAGLLDDCHVRARGLAEYLEHHFTNSISPTIAAMAAALCDEKGGRS
jgi:hypothetical protein